MTRDDFLLVAVTILAVVSSEPIGGRRTRDVRDIVTDAPSDRSNSSHSLNENGSEDYDQTNGSNGLDAVPGIPGKDYPNFNFIPKTSFTCSDKKPGGYYADIETRCQVFHVCNVGDVKSSFLCPPGSIFNQKYLVCDWWYDFECEHARDLFSYKETATRGSNFDEGTGEFYTSNENSQLDSRQESSFSYQENNYVNDVTDLSLAGTGEGGLGYSRNKSNKQFAKSDQDSQRNVNSTRQFAKISTYDFHQNVNNENGKRNQNQNGNYNRNYQSENKNSNYQNNNANIERNRQSKNENYNRNYPNENESKNYQTVHENAKNYQNANNGNRENENGFKNENFDKNRNDFPDSIPRGFAVNYGVNFRNQISPNSPRDDFAESKNLFTTPTIVNYLRKDESNFPENYNIPYQSTENSQNHENESFQDDNDETIFNIDDEDAVDRQRQLEVDNTILNKKHNFDNTGEYNFDYDAESRILSSERPPLQSHDNYNYYEDKSNPPFYSHSKTRENFANRNNEPTENSDRFNNDSNSDGFDNKPNSQAINNERKLDRNLRPPDFSTPAETANSNLKGFANKETAHHSDITSNSKDNGFVSSRTQSSRSFSQINEFTTAHDNSRSTNEKSDFRQSPNDQQNAYDYNAQNHYDTSFNYENANQPQTKII